MKLSELRLLDCGGLGLAPSSFSAVDDVLEEIKERNRVRYGLPVPVAEVEVLEGGGQNESSFGDSTNSNSNNESTLNNTGAGKGVIYLSQSLTGYSSMWLGYDEMLSG